jgi:hypothetical protein
MSMIGNLLRVTKNELEQYIKNSSLLEKRIYNDDSGNEDSNLVDIDKSWDGIIFLLTGQNFEHSNHPLTKVLFSGQIIDEEQDLGYGPGQYLTAEQVIELNEQISKISIGELIKKYDPKRMIELGVYPNIWENEEEINYLIEYFQTIQEVYAQAAKNGEAIITFLN